MFEQSEHMTPQLVIEQAITDAMGRLVEARNNRNYTLFNQEVFSTFSKLNKAGIAIKYSELYSKMKSRFESDDSSNQAGETDNKPDRMPTTDPLERQAVWNALMRNEVDNLMIRRAHIESKYTQKNDQGKDITYYRMVTPSNLMAIVGSDGSVTFINSDYSETIAQALKVRLAELDQDYNVV